MDFKGIEILYGQKSFSNLVQSHVAIIGVGGVGSWTAEALVRSGIGKLSLMDMDEVCVSNTNRQIHTTQETLGRKKIEVLKQRFLTINPHLEVHLIDDFFTTKTSDAFFENSYDLIIDAIDGLSSKCLLLSMCREKQRRVISVCSAGGRKDPTQIRIGDLGCTKHDPFAFRLRKKLKREFGFPKFENKKFEIPCVYSEEFPLDGQYEEEGNACDSSRGSSCAVTGAFGFVAASLALDLLTQKS